MSAGGTPFHAGKERGQGGPAIIHLTIISIIIVIIIIIIIIIIITSPHHDLITI
jgi:hypothetical protein